MKQPDFDLIIGASEWASCRRTLADAPRLAVDLEANSMFAYREQVCLIQISTPKKDFIIDPLVELDLSLLGDLFADSRIEKIFHAAEYDLILMKRQFGWEVNGLFDTMWAARILGYPRYGLASLLDEFYGVKLNKRYQRSNWCQRPLTPEQLSYACYDTHFLFDLRERLAVELQQNGREHEAAEIFAEQARVEPGDNGFDQEGFWSIQGVQDLGRQNQAVLKACYIYRDQEARKRNQPHFKIFSDRTLLEIAKVSPKSMGDLAQVHGMSRGQLRRYGQNLLQVVQEALHAKPPRAPRRRQRRPDEVASRYDRLHTWRKIKARERGVESDVIISRNALWEIAESNPKSVAELDDLESVGPWRSRTYGVDIIRVLQNSRNGR